jgi:AraC-like DNA-binding protein
MPETRHHRLVAAAAAWHLGAGERIESHYHDQAQLVYPARGLLAVTTSRGTWIAPPHRAVWIPEGEDHHHRSYGITDMRALTFDSVLTADQRPEPAVVAVSGLLRELILALTGRAGPPAPARHRLERVTLDQLLEAPEQPLYLPEPADGRLRAVTRLLAADPATPATLPELGHAVGASERTLSRLFHAELQMSFQQWRTQLRIHHALVLLAEGNTVTATAIRLGWANPSAFIAAFARTTGRTPGRYLSELRAATWINSGPPAR